MSHRKEYVKMEEEIGAKPPEPEESRTDSPQSLWKKHGPAHRLDLGLRFPGL